MADFLVSDSSVGGYPQSLDRHGVLRYINAINTWGEFSPVNRLEERYILRKIPTEDIPRSPYLILEDTVHMYADMPTDPPPIVINYDVLTEQFEIVDGGHRREASDRRKDSYMWAYIGIKQHEGPTGVIARSIDEILH